MHPRRVVALALCALAPTLAPVVARAAPLQVAVVPALTVNVDAARADALGGDLAAALTAELDVEARGGLEVRRQLPAEGLPADCVATPACAADVARRTGAAQLLFIVIVDAGGVLQIDATWVDPATGASEARPAIDLASPADARARFAAAARALLPGAAPRPRPAATGGLRATSAGAPRHLTTPAKITGAAAVVGLGVGIGAGLAARSAFSRCEASPAACTPGERDGIRDRALAADLGYAVALGAGIATAILYATSGREAGLVVAPTAEGAAITAIGRF